MKWSCGKLSIHMVIDWSIFKNSQITLFRCFIFTPKQVWDYLRQVLVFTVNHTPAGGKGRKNLQVGSAASFLVDLRIAEGRYEKRTADNHRIAYRGIFFCLFPNTRAARLLC